MCLLVLLLCPQFFSFLIGFLCNSVIVANTKSMLVPGSRKDTTLMILFNQKVQYELHS